MPRRTDIESILIIGSGPIVIGQACEFDYSGTQACRVLREEGFRVVLVNSNPATIMTDPDFADATYIEPLTVDMLKRIIEKERPDALLPTLGGQTALNLAIALDEQGVLEQFGVEMIGARPDAIRTAEDRELFKYAMTEVGLNVPASGFAHTTDEALQVADEIGYPVIVRPSFILGGGGTGIAQSREEMQRVAAHGLAASPITQILVERSVVGWKEFELEVMRDLADNCVVICSIENLDPMGVHTGDSITVAPVQTLTDVEYQRMRDNAFTCIRRIGVDTGGSNIQFAVSPETGEQLIIEMNPRVSRSSALASKATGFPIAKIAARLAVGYRLDEIQNDITGETPASFEPTIDYVVTKIPRWAFEKLPGVEPTLGTQMQSVGEVMALGRTFPESLQKALRSLETGRAGLNADPGERNYELLSEAELMDEIRVPAPERLFYIAEALRRGVTVERIVEVTQIDRWFCDHMVSIVALRKEIEEFIPAEISKRNWRRIKQHGFSDAQLSYLWGIPIKEVAELRERHGVTVTYKTVDTCAAEFEAKTPYFYSTFEDENEAGPLGREAVVILGSGPNRIGQGVEFDYCCVHAAFAVSESNRDSVMINCNPETVSTDYDTSDRLFFEPLTAEDVLAVCRSVRPRGVVVSLGGQTPLKLAHILEEAGISVLGTQPPAIDLAEDRDKFNELCASLGIPQPAGGTAATFPEARKIVGDVGYPVLVRPSYVLGGRAMRIVFDDEELSEAMYELTEAGTLGREGGLSAERPVLIDRFLEEAVEVDVDAIRDNQGEVLIGGVMEHIEEAGVHSGDSACATPPPNLSSEIVAKLERYTTMLAEALDVCGLLNVQYAVKDDEVFILEANPRASRTVPFISKATGVPLAKIATHVMLGSSLAELRDQGVLVLGGDPDHVSVKAAVLPFSRFHTVDTLLGPEMRSTGEVMGIDRSFGLAFAKSQFGAGNKIPLTGTIFMSLADRDKAAGTQTASRFVELGLEIIATEGTAKTLADAGIPVADVVAKIGESGLDAVDLIASGRVDFVVNTPRGRGTHTDGDHIRRAANQHRVPCVTTVSAARAAAAGIAEWLAHEPGVRSLQEYHREQQLKLGV